MLKNLEDEIELLVKSDEGIKAILDYVKYLETKNQNLQEEINTIRNHKQGK